MTFLLRPCSTILPVTVALEASPPVRIFWSSVWTLKIEPNFTCSPTSPDTLSTRIVSPGATRYCFPPDLITAYIAPPELKANHNYTGARHDRQCMSYCARLRVRVCFVVDVHQLANRCVRIFLRSGKRLVAEEFLNGAEVGTVGKQVRGEGVAHRVRMQIPMHVCQANVFFYDATNGALRKAAASVVEEDCFAVRGTATPPARPRLQQELFAYRPICFQRFLRFAAVGNDAFLVALAAHAQHFFVSVHVDEVQSSEFADAQARGVEKLQQRAIALQHQAFLVRKF